MVYKIPMEDVQSLAKSFSQLESGEWVLTRRFSSTALLSPVYLIFFLCVFSQANLQLWRVQLLPVHLRAGRLTGHAASLCFRSGLFTPSFPCFLLSCRCLWSLPRSRRTRRTRWAPSAQLSSGSGCARTAPSRSTTQTASCTSSELHPRGSCPVTDQKPETARLQRLRAHASTAPQTARPPPLKWSSDLCGWRGRALHTLGLTVCLGCCGLFLWACGSACVCCCRPSVLSESHWPRGLQSFSARWCHTYSSF